MTFFFLATDPRRKNVLYGHLLHNLNNIGVSEWIKKKIKRNLSKFLIVILNRHKYFILRILLLDYFII